MAPVRCGLEAAGGRLWGERMDFDWEAHLKLTGGPSLDPPAPPEGGGADGQPEPTEGPPARRPMWRVVGGAERGGIPVWMGRSSNQIATERLSCGALIEEIRLDGDKLHYEKVSGLGPSTGWVYVTARGKAHEKVITLCIKKE
mmetsp:Transcript_103552/g.288328  ORF Transcript_103552/g.288328 Transcript_103552/m.288328 type:complete len:143 (+) Transcript_103552:105-533(+)